MAHITLSISDAIYEDMKKHPEINWSAVARASIIEKSIALGNKTNSKELFNLISKETQESILKVKESKDFSVKVRKEGLKRTKFLTQV